MRHSHHDSDGHKVPASASNEGGAGAPETTICEMAGVRGGDVAFPVSLVCDEETKRLMLRGINEGGFSCVDIDLLDIVGWLHGVAPMGVNVDEITRAIAALTPVKGHRKSKTLRYFVCRLLWRVALRAGEMALRLEK